MSLSDPLTLLRDCASANKPITETDTQILFGRVAFHKNAPTAYRASTKDHFYTLEELLFFLNNNQKPIAQYVKDCGAKKFKPVSLPDRKNLLAYLTGKADSSPSIDFAAAPPVRPLDDEIEEPAVSAEADKMQVEGYVDLEAAAGADAEAAEAAAAAKAILSRILQAENVVQAGADEAKANASMDESTPSKRVGILEAARPYIRANRAVTKEIAKRERPLFTRRTLLQAPVASYPVVTHILEEFRKRNASASSHKGIVDETGGKVSKNQLGSSRRPPSAIIIVPSGLTSIVSSWNFDILLKEKRLLSSVDAKSALGGQRKVMPIKLSHMYEDGLKLEVEITDSPLKLSKSDWGRVACVIVAGNSWQFKGWPYHDQTDLFSKVFGIEFRFRDEAPNQLTKGWNILTLQVSKQRTKDHEVGATVLRFWKELRKSISHHNPRLIADIPRQVY